MSGSYFVRDPHNTAIHKWMSSLRWCQCRATCAFNPETAQALLVSNRT
jgi:hypothetical protein